MERIFSMVRGEPWRRATISLRRCSRVSEEAHRVLIQVLACLHFGYDTRPAGLKTTPSFNATPFARGSRPGGSICVLLNCWPQQMPKDEMGLGLPFQEGVVGTGARDD